MTTMHIPKGIPHPVHC